MKHIKFRLILMNFFQFAVWGAYLTSMGTYLGKIGLGEKIGLFYAMQGIVSLFMPAVIGIVADRWIPAQRLLGYCHLLAAVFMAAAGIYCVGAEPVSFSCLFTFYSLSVAFYMPTLALSNSVAYNALDKAGLDTVKDFPPIRVFGTIGFICSMWIVDLLGFQDTHFQFFVCAAWGLLLAVYAHTLPACPVSRGTGQKKTLAEAMGLKAFLLFKQKKMALFFIFSMLLGVSLQITNGFANPFISSFATIPQYADTFGVQHANLLISLSQISETCCILLIPFFLSRFGIKKVMLIAMFAWVFRFGLFGLGNPGSGVWMFVLSMIVYGVAFDLGAVCVDDQWFRGYYRHAFGAGGREPFCGFQQHGASGRRLEPRLVHLCRLCLGCRYSVHAGIPLQGVWHGVRPGNASDRVPVGGIRQALPWRLIAFLWNG